MKNNSKEIKNLINRRNNLKINVASLLEEKIYLDKKYLDEKTTLKNVDKKIDELKERQKNPAITDHAMLRYIERIVGLDVESLRNEILASNVIDKIEILNSGKIPIKGGLAVVKDKTIITILT